MGGFGADIQNTIGSFYKNAFAPQTQQPQQAQPQPWTNTGGGVAGGMAGGHAYAAGPTGYTGASDAPLAGPGYQEDFYKQHGQDLLNTPSASETLFGEGAAGSNPFYDYAQQQTIKAINDQSAARGNFNSSYTMRNIGNAVADLRGQQAHELGMLAGQADSGKFARYDRSNEYAGDAQNQLQNRMNAGINAYTGLADKQAGQVGGFYGNAGKEMSDANKAAIELELKRAGLTQEEIAAVFKGIGTGAGDVVKAVAA